jgi:predicted ABC-type ATPase
LPNSPLVVILAGPNGAGKSTAAPSLLRDSFGVDEFVNADAIALGLSSFAPEGVALEAGRITLERLNALALKRARFAFETTLAGRFFARWTRDLMAVGYQSYLLFLSLPSAEAAIQRVANRVSLGGHNIPLETIERRFRAGLHNFFRLYRPIVTSWMFFDNSFADAPKLLAKGRASSSLEVFDGETYGRFLKEFGNEQ